MAVVLTSTLVNFMKMIKSSVSELKKDFKKKWPRIRDRLLFKVKDRSKYSDKVIQLKKIEEDCFEKKMDQNAFEENKKVKINIDKFESNSNVTASPDKVS